MTDTNINKNLIRHGKWDFEYGFRTNTFKTDVDSYEKSLFEQTIIDPTVKVQDHSLNNNHLTESDISDFRRAAIIHKIARKKALSMLYEGNKVGDLVDAVEDTILKMCKQDPATYYVKGSPADNQAGIAFPVGVNINNIVAHDSKIVNRNNKTDDRIFFKGDLVKVDIGVHINGRIIDSAFSHIISNKVGIHDKDNIYNPVIEASRDSMFNAIKMVGPDQRLDEISECISDVIQSYEVDMGGVDIPIKPVKGIGGHNIKKYQIHGGKFILSDPDYELQKDLKIEEDEIYAIETYTTTGMGIMTQNSEMSSCTHYMQTSEADIENNKAITKKDKKYFKKTELYEWLKTRSGLPFSSTWISSNNSNNSTIIPKLDKAFKLAIPSGQIIAFPPLYDENNSVVAQFEHTIHVNDGSVEIFSLGEDY